MNLQKRLEIQAFVQQWADNFMKTYNVSASELIDALTKVLNNLQKQEIVEYFSYMTLINQQSNIDLENNISSIQEQEDADNA